MTAACTVRPAKTAPQQQPDLIGVAPTTRAAVDICLMGALTEAPRLALLPSGYHWLTVTLQQPGDYLPFVASLRAEMGDATTLQAFAKPMVPGALVLVRGSGLGVVERARIRLLECRLIRAVRIDPDVGLVFL